MSKSKFKGSITIDFEIEIDDRILRMCQDQEWKDKFYRFHRNEDVALNLAYNMLRNTRDVGNLDGFAEFGRDDVQLTQEHWNEDDCQRVIAIREKDQKSRGKKT